MYASDKNLAGYGSCFVFLEETLKLNDILKIGNKASDIVSPGIHGFINMTSFPSLKYCRRCCISSSTSGSVFDVLNGSTWVKFHIIYKILEHMQILWKASVTGIVKYRLRDQLAIKRKL